MERRRSERIPSDLPVEVAVDDDRWFGTLINRSAEGALLKLDGLWGGAAVLTLDLAPHSPAPGPGLPARVVRASSPDGRGTFLALRFV